VTDEPLVEKFVINSRQCPSHQRSHVEDSNAVNPVVLFKELARLRDPTVFLLSLNGWSSYLLEG
jgi:hypothetical protein